MTEREWFDSRDPERLLNGCPCRPPERKLRLLGCGCCRAVWDRFTDDRTRRAVEVVERFADGLATEAEMAVAERESSTARDLAIGSYSTAPRRHRSRHGRGTSWAAHALTNIPPGRDKVPTVFDDLLVALDRLQYTRRGDVRAVRAAQADLARDVLGNPFRPVALDPAWLTPTVGRLAHGVYDDRAFDRLPVLADALEDAGCDHPEVLAHCRGKDAHARGCWVVDRLRGRE